MTSQEQAFIEFLHWLDESSYVPTKTKHAFLEHVAKSGKLDNKAIEFIEYIFAKADELQQQTKQTLSDEWQTLNATLQVQAQPDNKLELKVAKAASKRMHNRVLKFNKYYHKVEGQKRVQQESTEQQTEADQVAALKASL